MKNPIQLTRLPVAGLALALGLSFLAATAQANPYATCLTNAAGTVSFRLNENGATVAVIGNGGTLSNYLGVLNRGLTETNLTGSGMTGGVFQVVVAKTGSGAPTLISDDTLSSLWFWSPRGVAVNRRPASPYFGRVYVGNGFPGTTTVPGSRTTGDGIYVVNADGTDAVGQGDTERTAGLDMQTTTASMPFRLTVGEDDDMLYICNWTDTQGNLYRTDPDVSDGTGVNVFQTLTRTVDYLTPVGTDNNHGSIAVALVTGSLAGGNLTVWTGDEDLQTDRDAAMYNVGTECNSLWRYDIGSGSLPYNDFFTNKVVTPSIPYQTTGGGQVLGLARGSNGYFYYLDSRSAGAQNLLQVLGGGTNNADVLYTSLQASLDLGFTYDILSNSVSCAVSPDQKYIATIRNVGIVVLIPLTDGIPDLAARTEFSMGATSGARDIAFDAANNLYVTCSSTERLRVYSLGQSGKATTGSDGTFSFEIMSNVASVTITSIAGTSLNYTGGSGARFILLKSANLTTARSSWTPVATNTVTPGTFTIPAVGTPPSPTFFCIRSE